MGRESSPVESDSRRKRRDSRSPDAKKNRDADRNRRRDQSKERSRSPPLPPSSSSSRKRAEEKEEQDVKPLDKWNAEKSPKHSEKSGKGRRDDRREEKGEMSRGVKREAKSPERGGSSSKFKPSESDIAWGKRTDPYEKPSKEVEREKPSFEPSGKLAADTNTFKGVVIKYNEPPEAKVPRVRWRLYPFRGEEHLPVIYIHRQSAYLIGRDRKIADFPIDHPSCSKQHAALQYRSLPYSRSDGSHGRRTRPYIIDLGSGNGTFLNGQRIEAQRYVELKEKDVLKFGFSSREYVVLNENSLEGDDDSESGEEDKAAGIDISEAAEERLKTQDDDGMF